MMSINDEFLQLSDLLFLPNLDNEEEIRIHTRCAELVELQYLKQPVTFNVTQESHADLILCGVRPCLLVSVPVEGFEMAKISPKNMTKSNKALSEQQKTYIRNQYPFLSEENKLGFVRWVIRIMKGY